MNDEFVKNALSFGEEGKQWLKQIPETIKKYEEKWQIQALPPYTLTYNYVAPVIQSNGVKAVLKIGRVQDKEFQTEIEALSLFNGDGIVKLLQVDKTNAVILMEEVIPGVPLSTIDDDEKATRTLASVMKKLWKPLPNNHPFITIAEWTSELKEYPALYRNKTAPIPLSLVDKATKLFSELIATFATPVLTHADLHHDNVLSSSREEWLAIDPKGIAAEPAYETAALLRNPYKKLKAMNNIDELLRKRILILSEELAIDPKRIQQWGLAQTILSGVWTRDNADYTAHALKVIRSLERITV